VEKELEEPNLTMEAVCERVFRIEDEHDLFDLRVGGVPIWERIRFGVHRQLLQQLGLTGQAHAGSQTSKLDSASRMARNLWHRNPLFAPSNDILAWGHERRKRLDDGHWWDIYVDPVVDALDEEVTYLERLFEGDHLTPPRTDTVWHLDFVELAPAAVLEVIDDARLLSSAEEATLAGVESVFETEFGVRPDVVTKAGRHLVQHRIQRPLFEAVLRRVDPELALMVVSYGREPFVEACKNVGITTIELQHGTFSRYHLGYSYPGTRSKEAFPDYFFTFGEFWGSMAELPISDDYVVPVGYPYLESEVEKRTADTLDNRIIFLSQGTVGPHLSQFAVEFAEAEPNLDVVYKLHPGEYSRWEREYPWLVEAPLTVSTDTPLYDLFTSATAQVGVYSTALYEGLCFDLATYVVDLPGVAYMNRLIEQGGAERVESPGELSRAFGTHSSETVDTEPFFRTGAVENVRDAIATVRRQEQ
jgi:hypothetical protein